MMCVCVRVRAYVCEKDSKRARERILDYNSTCVKACFSTNMNTIFVWVTVNQQEITDRVFFSTLPAPVNCSFS